ncbi:MAG TPA: TfoX/Sxy family protein [Arenimonas sp.]|uniref:TfoX/Sxy family protein n=1 Tax=Arenimonas sp. TaxID=1872635 RepID=UPI002D167177|nr:TfoX/Sxy family protein [Arenimonas sp.]HMB56717.1 TfoX/Sxy family protein [Arenimonas sp.]
MKRDDGFIAYLHELLDPLGTISTRRMFGGHGIYCDGVFFAIVIDERIYLKVDEESRGRFHDAGCAPFVYESRGEPIAMSYWSVPDEAMDSAEQMQPWAKLAIAAALRKPEKKKRSRSKSATR